MYFHHLVVHFLASLLIKATLGYYCNLCKVELVQGIHMELLDIHIMVLVELEEVLPFFPLDVRL